MLHFYPMTTKTLQSCPKLLSMTPANFFPFLQNNKNPQTDYHLLAKETLVQSTITRILSYAVAQSLCPTGFTMAHLYGLPNAHREKLAIRSVLSATHTYYYVSENWLDYKLKPLSLSQHTVTYIFDFVNELPRDLNITPRDLLVSYAVSSLYTNEPLDETIKILAN